MAVKRLIERVAAPFAGTVVDRDKGVIRGVKLCGATSDNGRDYPPAVFRAGIAKYEGVPIYADHARDRSIDRKFGWIENARVDADGTPRGDAHLLKSHAMYGPVMEAAERNPRLFGFSHVADCDTRPGANGRERIESLVAVESVDLVAEPATTKGFFEGKTVSRISLKQFVERFGPKWGAKRWASATQLCEDIGDAAGAPVMDEPAADASPEDLQTGLMAALQPMLADAFETGDSDKACAALRDFVKLHAKHTGKAEPEAKPEPADEGKKKKTAADGTASIREAIAVCQKVGFKGFDADDLELIERTPAEKREAVAKRLMGTAAGGGAERPESGDRHRTTKIDEQKLREGQGDGKDKPPSGAKEFGKWLSESDY